MKTVLIGILSKMAKLLPFFNSEMEFKAALSAELIKAGCTGVSFEVSFAIAPKPTTGSSKYLKIDLATLYKGKKVVIEVKYKTAKMSYTNLFGLTSFLTNQGAQDIGRYLVWKDVDRIESLKAAGICDEGYVVFLTNDAAYWNPKASLTIDSKFKDFTVPNQDISWTPVSKTQHVTPFGYEPRKSKFPNFVLSKVYGPFDWNHYSSISGKNNGEFKYIIIDI